MLLPSLRGATGVTRSLWRGASVFGFGDLDLVGLLEAFQRERCMAVGAGVSVVGLLVWGVVRSWIASAGTSLLDASSFWSRAGSRGVWTPWKATCLCRSRPVLSLPRRVPRVPSCYCVPSSAWGSSSIWSS